MLISESWRTTKTGSSNEEDIDALAISILSLLF